MSAKSGEAFIKAFQRKQYAEQAKTTRLLVEFNFAERLLDLSGRDLKAEQDEEKSQEDYGPRPSHEDD